MKSLQAMSRHAQAGHNNHLARIKGYGRPDCQAAGPLAPGQPGCRAMVAGQLAVSDAMRPYAITDNYAQIES